MEPINHLHTATTILVAILITGCASLPTGSSEITIRSEPPGATVLADGAELGVTPLSFNPSESFRSGFTGGKEGLLVYRYIGKLIVKKPGCKDYVLAVDDNILSKDIDVRLECDPGYRPPVQEKPVVEQSAPREAPVMDRAAETGMPASAEERLRRIESLHDKGLISDTEYRQLRQRVLDTL